LIKEIAVERTGEAADLLRRCTKEVLDDHLRCRKESDVEADIMRNYSSGVVILTSRGVFEGHEAVRILDSKLREHVPDNYEILLNLTTGPYGYIEWRARAGRRAVEDGADSFVVEEGKIVFQSIHYTVQEAIPL
jgi:hypothetical protein